MDHNAMFQMHDWLRSQRKMFQSRLVILLLITINFSNSTILCLDALGADSLLAILLFIVNSFVVIAALLGIYHSRPVLLIPNVVMKVALSSAALFYGLQLAESNDTTSVCHFIWLLITVFLFIWEIQAMFSATFGIIKQLNDSSLSKPPPSYNQVVLDEDAPPTYSEAVQTLSVAALHAVPAKHDIQVV